VSRRPCDDDQQRAGRPRSGFQWQAGFFVAVSPDRQEALHDAKATLAFYAGAAQYEPLFEAHGFGEEARACQAAVRGHDYAGAGAALKPPQSELRHHGPARLTGGCN
jgi:hypothetical protein